VEDERLNIDNRSFSGQSRGCGGCLLFCCAPFVYTALIWLLGYREVIDGGSFMLFAVTCAVLSGLSIWAVWLRRTAPFRKEPVLYGVFVFGAPWLVLAVVFVNRLNRISIDPPRKEIVEVYELHHSEAVASGRHRSPASNEARVSSWRPHESSLWVNVPRAVYDQLQVRDTVELTVRRGCLGYELLEGVKMVSRPPVPQRHRHQPRRPVPAAQAPTPNLTPTP
jgi:hypothetical protein